MFCLSMAMSISVFFVYILPKYPVQVFAMVLSGGFWFRFQDKSADSPVRSLDILLPWALGPRNLYLRFQNIHMYMIVCTYDISMLGCLGQLGTKKHVEGTTVVSNWWMGGVDEK